MGNSKGNMVLLTVMSIATLLVAVVGATFAYFGALMPTGESSPTFEVTSGTLAAEYNGDANIINGNVLQGESIGVKEISVTGIVTGSNNLNYEVTLAISANSYLDGELAYTITSYNESNNGSTIATTTEPVAIPTGATTISLGSGVFAEPTTSGLSHKYTVNIVRVNTADMNPERTFNARLFTNQTKK